MMLRGLEYIQNTGGNVTQASFEEDWSPVGSMMWEDLIKAEYIKEMKGEAGVSGFISITEAGYAALTESHGKCASITILPDH